MKSHVLIIILIGGLVLFGPAGVAYAFIGYGGYNIIPIPCTVTPGVFLIYIAPLGPTSPPNLLYTPASILYSQSAFLAPSVPVLGLYSVLGPCFVWMLCPPVGVPCPVLVGFGFNIIMEGTGL